LVYPPTGYYRRGPWGRPGPAGTLSTALLASFAAVDGGIGQSRDALDDVELQQLVDDRERDGDLE